MSTISSDTQSAAPSWENDPLWHKDAIIYQLHVKAFFDGNDDGIGDFKGLSSRLDYIQELGVNTIWLLPFYPSPMRDDGYDIASYREINASFGTRRDFRNFVREAHKRNLRVITELVINHTSDQHAWFQAARRAPKGSSKRNFYVWSDTDQKYDGTRIIFTDTETSNWAWDPVAQQYYWHRFFSHQPDLNFANPSVVKAVIRVMRYWLDMGVDGMRLDAIPYLCEREGTNNENLPETHEVIKEMRAVVDAHYDRRVFLAEANQWPEDVMEYFGNADECHMAYHFPLMPRIYMAIAQQDRHPIVEIMDQTPAIPDSCQWAVFLRNHDELTLEMVTDEERDYMYETYAKDPRMRVNVGIRRRLAPLMDNDVERIKLMNTLLLSMPGSPIIYYGDEIGMGDNIFLGDRNGVRTPMQWSPDRNGGFSRADPQQLYLPPIMDPIYGFEAVNVEAQSREMSSLLNWMRRLISVRKAHKAFGRGTLEFLRPGNRAVLAFLREYAGETLLCVANLARSAQPAELDLRRFRGRIPVEMMGRTSFPPIGELPYFLTLPGYAFYWFRLTAEEEAPSWHVETLPRADLPVLVLFEGWQSFFPDQLTPAQRGTAEQMHARLVGNALPAFIQAQRWFGAKAGVIERVHISERAVWPETDPRWLLLWVDVHLAGGEVQRYFLPLGTAWGDTREARIRELLPTAVARIRTRARIGVLYDAFANPAFCRALIDAMAHRGSHPVPGGRLSFHANEVFEALRERIGEQPEMRLPDVPGSNTTAIVGDALFLKAYRRCQRGTNPELEIGRFLTERTEFRNFARIAGAIEHAAEGEEPTTLALLQEYLPTQGDGWLYVARYLEDFLEKCLTQSENDMRAGLDDYHALHLDMMERLGSRTGELHAALASSRGEPNFDPEPVEPADLERWREEIDRSIGRTADLIEARAANLPAGLQPQALEAQAQARDLPTVLARLLAGGCRGLKTRLHGDYHLGQVLVAQNDFIIIDFEGEPARPLADRRRKDSPLKDVSGMLRSLSYAAHSALRRLTTERSVDSPQLMQAYLRDWETRASGAFIDGYAAATRTAALYTDLQEAMRLVKLFMLEKVLYEIRYEFDHRPEWAGIPLAGLRGLIGELTAPDA